MSDRKRNKKSDSGGSSETKSKHEAKKANVTVISADFEEKVFQLLEKGRFKKNIQLRLEDFLGERIGKIGKRTGGEMSQAEDFGGDKSSGREGEVIE
ncbi:hypothetical protein CRE_25043 [Caenorhabditis remanei]|uniref:Uncharacterized protein n=1 Tax=Caenorhabditis remanei TaxID=31234 RepID=E3NW51_CAERE|nr:hypothetical protein CRE_25043 [Caenorhabditis remanei]